MKLFPYLSLYGNARQAMQKYKTVFNAKIKRINEYKGSPLENQTNKHLILHCEIQFNGNIICLADYGQEVEKPEIEIGKMPKQQPFELCMNFEANQLDNAKRIFQQLSADGQVLLNFQKTFWQAYYGKLKDTFGIVWSINCQIQPQKVQEVKISQNQTEKNASVQKNNDI